MKLQEREVKELTLKTGMEKGIGYTVNRDERKGDVNLEEDREIRGKQEQSKGVRGRLIWGSGGVCKKGR